MTILIEVTGKLPKRALKHIKRVSDHLKGRATHHLRTKEMSFEAIKAGARVYFNGELIASIFYGKLAIDNKPEVKVIKTAAKVVKTAARKAVFLYYDSSVMKLNGYLEAAEFSILKKLRHIMVSERQLLSEIYCF